MENASLRRPTVLQRMASFSFDTAQSVAEDIRAKYGFDGDLLAMFANNKGRLIQKWHHYIPLYDRYFSRFRGQPIRFLEIGVSEGGSLQLWRQYFGPTATIYGIDIKKPGMKYAVVARPPGFGQIPDKINDAAAKAIPGVFGVYPFDDKIAIVANDTWTALKARKALDVSWTQKTAAENE